MFDRIAVVNRGEPALRLIRAVRELNAEHGTRTRVVALHTEAERRATFVRAADEAVLLHETGNGSPYLDHAELGRALRASGADAAWVGWGFVAEDPAFAELCEKLGVTFIGPSAAAGVVGGGGDSARYDDRGGDVLLRAGWQADNIKTLTDSGATANCAKPPLRPRLSP